MIEQYAHWNEDTGEWQLKCVAYTGNNMRKQTTFTDPQNARSDEADLSHVYLAYTPESREEAMRAMRMGTKHRKSSKKYVFTSFPCEKNELISMFSWYGVISYTFRKRKEPTIESLLKWRDFLGERFPIFALRLVSAAFWRPRWFKKIGVVLSSL